MRAVASALASFALAAAPALAEACPACARDQGGPGYLALLGAMIVLPFLIVRAAVKAIRSDEQGIEE